MLKQIPHLYDVAIVGGGVAGLIAATILARAHRKVIVIDNSQQSNRVSKEIHGTFTRDKIPPKQLYALANQQLQTYPTVKLLQARVSEIKKGNPFVITVSEANDIFAHKILLAQGVEYVQPAVRGLHALWGTKAWHCPYCSGYEAAGKRLLAIFTKDRVNDHMQHLLSIWNDNVIWLQPEDIEEIVTRKEEIEVRRSNGKESLLVDQIITQVTPMPRDNLADKLGCVRTDRKRILIDSAKMTSVKGIYAAGDQASDIAQINLAVASGHAAAMSINSALNTT